MLHTAKLTFQNQGTKQHVDQVYQWKNITWELIQPDTYKPTQL